MLSSDIIRASQVTGTVIAVSGNSVIIRSSNTHFTARNDIGDIQVGDIVRVILDGRQGIVIGKIKRAKFNSEREPVVREDVPRAPYDRTIEQMEDVISGSDACPVCKELIDAPLLTTGKTYCACKFTGNFPIYLESLYGAVVAGELDSATWHVAGYDGVGSGKVSDGCTHDTNWMPRSLWDPSSTHVYAVVDIDSAYSTCRYSVKAFAQQFSYDSGVVAYSYSATLGNLNATGQIVKLSFNDYCPIIYPFAAAISGNQKGCTIRLRGVFVTTPVYMIGSKRCGC